MLSTGWFLFGNGMANLNNVTNISKGKGTDGKYQVMINYITGKTSSFSFEDESKMNEFYDKIKSRVDIDDYTKEIADYLYDIKNSIDGVISGSSLNCNNSFEYNDDHITAIDNSLSNISDKMFDINAKIGSKNDGDDINSYLKKISESIEKLCEK